MATESTKRYPCDMTKALLSLLGVLILVSLLSTPVAGSSSAALGESDLKSFQAALTKNDDRKKDLGELVAACEKSGATECCGRIYADSAKKLWIVELCSAADKATPRGIYLFSGPGEQYFEWFDSKFNEWACAEKQCNQVDGDASGCGWELELGDKNQLKKATFRYDINLSHGQYVLEPAKGKRARLRIVAQKRVDEPS